MTSQADFHLLMRLVFILIESQAGKPLDENSAWRNNAQVMAIKMFRHLSSANRLCTPTEIDYVGYIKPKFIDHSSVATLGRTAFETYLAFHYVFVNEDQTLSEFRCQTWELAGLTDRSRLFASTTDSKEKLISEGQRISFLKSKISQNSHFHALSESHKKHIISGRWRANIPWKDLATLAGFHGTYFDSLYNHLSGHAHGSYISALQIRDASSSLNEADLSGAIVQLGCVLCAHLIHAYTRIFPDSALLVQVNPHLHSVAETWHICEEDMQHIYQIK